MKKEIQVFDYANEITKENKNICYPQDVDRSFHGVNKDLYQK